MDNAFEAGKVVYVVTSLMILTLCSLLSFLFLVFMSKSSSPLFCSAELYESSTSSRQKQNL